MNKGVWDIVRAQFVTSAVKAEQYPSPQMIEAAFIGRSNVGKSSLINSLCRPQRAGTRKRHPRQNANN